MTSNARIASIEIDDKSLAPAGPDAEHERKVAIFDLIESNSFKVIGHEGGPYNVLLSLADNRLVFEISEQDGSPVRKLLLSLTALRHRWAAMNPPVRGLLHDLRQLLRRDPELLAFADRGYRYGATGLAQ